MRRLFVETPLPFDEAARWATDEEVATARGFAAARGREYLAWRAIVRRELGRDTAIAYNSVGAPILTNRPLHISVSHCRAGTADSRKRPEDSRQIAVILSDVLCAVDIERIDRNFARILPRYLSPEEQRLSQHPLFPAVAWCAKEALYKYAGQQELDLLRDLHIDRISFPESSASKDESLPEGLANRSCGTIHARCTKASNALPPSAVPTCSDSPHDAVPCNRILHFYQENDCIVVFLFG